MTMWAMPIRPSLHRFMRPSARRWFHFNRPLADSSSTLKMPGPATKTWERSAVLVKNTDISNPYLEAIRDTHDPTMHLKTIEDELKGTIGKALGKQGDKIFNAVARMNEEFKVYEELLEQYETTDHPSVEESARRYNSIRKEAVQYRWELMVHRKAAGFIVNNHRYVMEHYPISEALPVSTSDETKATQPQDQTEKAQPKGLGSSVRSDKRMGLAGQAPPRRAFSVSATEVEKFNAMYADWWKPSKNPLISMNTIRVKYIRDQVALRLNTSSTPSSSVGPLSNLRALDIGCGGGLLSESLARLGASVTGVDPSQDLLATATHHATQTLESSVLERLEYKNQTAESLTDSMQNSFDIVCLLEVIEHVKDPRPILDSASRLLRPGGMLFISTMNRTLKSYLLTIVGAEYLAGYLPPGTHDFNLYRSPDEIKALVEPHGFQQLDTTGMVLARPPLLSFDWKLASGDTDVNWIGCYVKE